MISLSVIGLGNRAGKYLSCLSGDARVSCLVEPDSFRLQRAAELYGVPADHCFRSAYDFFASGIKVDGVIIAVPDQIHYPIAIEAVKRGFHVLVEKPAVTNQADYDSLLEASAKAKTPVGVCLVMRYHPYYKRIKELVGEVGQITEITHTEHIGPDRMGHTFVRGGWARKEDTGPIFLSKCSHDVDFILSLCGTGAKAVKVQSEGSIELFKRSKAPEGSTDRCINCPVRDCLYNAVNLYRERKEWIAGFDVPQDKTLDQVIDDVLQSSPFGRCVYRCQNDVYDTQKVRVELENGIKLSLSLEGTSAKEGRETVIKGTRGILRADGGIITCGSIREDYSQLENAPLHAGADKALVEDFLRSITEGTPMKASLEDAAESHRICFLAG
ncbi:MAG: Gfo/Idh/MocA family oxidoreductase [Bacteroidales bacterium]|nr:Gfo/Idh/MocA family oxidoreductase [Bacteroidales bacterium]